MSLEQHIYRFRASISSVFCGLIFVYTTMGGNHLILILACNWLHYADKNFLFQNMEISSQKMIFYTKKYQSP
jgi:cbb3-type cytochrome oxidase subunit 1